MPSFITIKFALWAVAGLFLALVAVVTVEEVRIGNWRAENKAQAEALTLAAANLATSKANVATCSAALDRQNAAVASLAQQNAALKAKRDAAARAVLEAHKGEYVVQGTGHDVMNAWIKHEFGGIQ